MTTATPSAAKPNYLKPDYVIRAKDHVAWGTMQWRRRRVPGGGM